MNKQQETFFDWTLVIAAAMLLGAFVAGLIRVLVFDKMF